MGQIDRSENGAKWAFGVLAVIGLAVGITAARDAYNLNQKGRDRNPNAVHHSDRRLLPLQENGHFFDYSERGDGYGSFIYFRNGDRSTTPLEIVLEEDTIRFEGIDKDSPTPFEVPRGYRFHFGDLDKDGDVELYTKLTGTRGESLDVCVAKTEGGFYVPSIAPESVQPFRFNRLRLAYEQTETGLISFVRWENYPSGDVVHIPITEDNGRLHYATLAPNTVMPHEAKRGIQYQEQDGIILSRR